MYNNYYKYIMSNRFDTTLYVGVTNDLERRVLEHKTMQFPGFTKKYNCDKLVYFETFSDINQAIEREKQIKGWRRERKDELINRVNRERIDLYERLQILRPSASE